MNTKILLSGASVSSCLVISMKVANGPFNRAEYCIGEYAYGPLCTEFKAAVECHRASPRARTIGGVRDSGREGLRTDHPALACGTD